MLSLAARFAQPGHRLLAVSVAKRVTKERFVWLPRSHLMVYLGKHLVVHPNHRGVLG